MQTDMIGVGPALRKAREHRGLSLEEAGRGTRLRADQLAALEDEDFASLPGDVYARASLRTYAGFLGLNPDKVIAAYARSMADPAPPPPPGGLGRVERMIAASRIRDNQRFLLVTAAVVVVTLIGFGLLSRQNATPAPAPIGTATPSVASSEIAVDAVLVAQVATGVTATVDGVPSSYRMSSGEQLSFHAQRDLTLQLDDGGSVQVVVGGVDYGVPGTPGEAWTRTFVASEVTSIPSSTPPSAPGSATTSP